jgi:hypothetical protein
MTSPEAEAAPLPPPLGRFEAPLAALVAAAAFSAVFVLPLFGVIGLPLASVPLVRLAHRQGLVAALAACALACAILFGLGWALGGLGAGVALAFVGAGVTTLPPASVGFLRAGVDPSRCYLGLCIAGCAFLAAAFAAAVSGPGPSLGAEVAASFDRLIPAAMDSYARSGANAETVAKLKGTFEAARDFAQYCLWGIMGVLWVFGGAIAFYLGAKLSRPGATADATRFELLRVPAAGAGFFVAAGAAFGLLEGEARRVAANLLLPLLALYFVAGLSIICHFFRRWFRARILRIGLYALAAYFPINVGVALLGLFDWYVDFRRRGEGVVEKS